ncbi:cyclin-dependent kinases regulatory subunit 1 isoform X2 [Parus major]|uniref:cyclin-dependent kinases regulatory subunit 1 isoform X2 n=1 Tax=Parus major TaxID=9157 RepID=UPI0007714414|nr:cyclin-dependent kinases regulatory subunit 1 isoform X2 [Parus major]
MAHKQIYYSDKHVMLPKDIAKLVPKTHLLSESEWRNLGVQQSQGWVHYMIHEAPHPALPTAIAQEARKVSGPWCAEAPGPHTLRKHLPPLLGISWGLHPLTLDAAWAPFWRLGPGSGGPFRCDASKASIK